MHNERESGFEVVFIENTYASQKLKELITRGVYDYRSGRYVSQQNAKQLVEAGADVLVAGSYIFKADNPTQTIADLKIDNDIKQKSPPLSIYMVG
jgi:heptaprenylglyceryl phosphate synthase